MNNNSEVLIIGGGIIGCAAAYYLAKRGCKATVLDKSFCFGDGGSSRNGGGVRQSGRDPRELPIAMWGIKNIWPTLSEELEFDCEYYQQGNLRLGKTEAHRNILQGLTDRAINCGLDVKMISGDEAREICPYLSDEVIVASWCPTDGHANPMATTLAFYRKARQLGAKFISGETIVELRKIKGKLRQAVSADGTVYEADTVILAAGYDSRELMASVGLDVPMHKELFEAVVTEAQPSMFYQMLGTAGADFYGHQTKHGSFVFGSSSGYELTNKDNGTPINSSLTASACCRGIMGYFPALKEAKIVRTWAGWLDICSDGVPVISPVEEVPGLILACAFTGHGFGIGPAVGKLLSQMVLDKQTELDLSALRYDRFKARV